MRRIYDYYGAREADRKHISDLVSEATGITFESRESYYIGQYFRGVGSPGRVEILPNELEDEEGKFLRWSEFADYKTILTVEWAMPAGTESPSYLDNLREKLRSVGELVFLKRSQSSRRPPADLAV